MDWDKLRIFHAVAKAGSLTHAGDRLNLSQSAVSRQIRGLEESLNVILFHRHARGLILTEQGELLYDATNSMSRRLEAASARIRDSEDSIFGELRVTTTIGFGSMWLAPRLDKLFTLYPDLRVDLMLEERVLDLPMREADVAIRMKEPSQADLIRKKLMTVRMSLFATQKYLDAEGVPQSPGDLSAHRLICQSPDSVQVGAGGRLSQSVLTEAPHSVLKVNNYFGVLQAVLHDLGIGILPNYVTQEHANLVQILPDVQSEEVPVFLAYPEELRHSKRVSAFRDFVQDEIREYRALKRQG